MYTLGGSSANFGLHMPKQRQVPAIRPSVQVAVNTVITELGNIRHIDSTFAELDELLACLVCRELSLDEYTYSKAAVVRSRL